MTAGIIIAAVLVVLAAVIVVLNHTDFWMNDPVDYKKLPFLSRYEDVEMTSKGAKKAILMLHEYAGIPDSVRELGEKLHGDGYDVFVPAMPGASATAEEFRSSPKPNYPLWYGFARDRFESLAARYGEVYIVGASIGGAIALDIAATFSPAAVVTLSSPVQVLGTHFRKRFKRNLMLRMSGVIALFVREVRTGILSPKAYEVSPVHGLEGLSYAPSLHSQKIGTDRLRRKLGRVACPVMALHALGDTTVDVKNASRIAAGVSSRFVVKKLYDVPEDVYSRKHRIAAHTLLKDKIYLDVKEFLAAAARTVK